jgi:hypothetical protein
LLMLRPVNVDTPEVALRVAVPESVPLDGLVVMARAIDAELPVTVLPPASWTVTTGCAVHAVPPVPPPGCVVKASLAAVPTVMLKLLLTALVRPLEEAVRT